MQAPFVDAASAIDPTNFSNTFISYYTYGAAIGLALDLAIRERFDGVSLDDVMRQMWQTHGISESPYTNDDIRSAVATVTGNERFANDFFARYINDSQLPDYESLLANAGMLLRKAHEGNASVGPVDLEFDGKDGTIENNTIIGTPLYDAGLDRGDQVIAIDRLNITGQGRWDSAIRRYEPGDTAVIRYIQRGVERSAEITFEEDRRVEVVSFESAELEVSDAQLAFREAWLGEDED